MSPRERFDRFMADVRNGTNFKLAALTHAHYRAFFSAVIPIASLCDIRGAFMVNGQPATVEQMRLMAPTLTTAECRSALEVFRRAGLLEHDEDLGGEWVHDFEEWNPEPKRDRTNAERQERYRARQKASRNGVTPVTHNGAVTASNAGEVEVEVEVPPTPQGADHGEGGKVITFRRARVPDDQRILAEAILDEFNRQAATSYGAYTGAGAPSEDLKRILGAIRDAAPPLTLDEAGRVIAFRLAHPYGGSWNGKPHTGAIFSPSVFPSNRESAGSGGINGTSSSAIDEQLARAEQARAERAAREEARA